MLTMVEPALLGLLEGLLEGLLWLWGDVGDGELPAAVAPDAGEAVEGGVDERVTPCIAPVST